MPNWFKKSGKVLKIGAKIATDENCCCSVPPEPCCCPGFDTLPPFMLFTLTGHIFGSITLPAELDPTECAEWGPDNLGLENDNPCFLIFDTVVVTLVCFGDLGTFGVTLEIEDVAVDCIITLVPVSQTCNNGGLFRGVWDYTITNCPDCEGETGQLIVDEVP